MRDVSEELEVIEGSRPGRGEFIYRSFSAETLQMPRRACGEAQVNFERITRDRLHETRVEQQPAS